MANNAPYALGPISSAPRMNAVTVVPGTNYNPPLTKLYVSVTGNLVLTMAQTGTFTLASAPVGWIEDLSVYSVGSATTATVTGFW